MSIRYLPDSPPVFDTARARARWAAAKADYLAGAGGPEVCERHGLKLSTFRWRAKQEGWRRADQTAPFIAPDPAPDPALPPGPESAPESKPPLQEDSFAMPPTPSQTPPPDAPLTATQMVDTAWAHVQAAFAAGRLIEARGWMRLYKDMKPIAREEQEAERRARMDREAAERPAPPPRPPSSRLSTNALSILAAEVKALARLTGDPRTEKAVRLQLDCFSDEESNAGPAP